MMGGRIDWAAVPIVGEFLGVQDYDELIRDMLCVLEHARRVQDNG